MEIGIARLDFEMRMRGFLHGVRWSGREGRAGGLKLGGHCDLGSGDRASSVTARWVAGRGRERA